VVKHGVVLVVLVVAARAEADIDNRGFLPFGERAAMLGNAGTTSAYGEAVYYNPANLTRIDHASLSVAASTYLKFDVDANPALVLAGQDEPFSASGFVPIPAGVISTYKLGGFSAATAILVPEALDFKNRSTLTGGGITATLLQQEQKESLWLGAGLAHPLADNLSIGLSLFAIRTKEGAINYTRLTDGVETVEVISNEDTSVISASAVLGVYWEPAPELGLALRVQSPTVRLVGTTDLYNSSVDTGNATQAPSATEQTIEGAHAARPLPLDLTLGVSWRPSPKLELVADVGLQMPEKATELEDPVAGTRVTDAKLAPRVGVGADITVGDKKWIRLGAMINRSAVASPKTEADPSRDDYYGLTGGFAFQKNRTLTSIGLFGLQSNTDTFVGGADPPRKADARVRLYGAMLSFTYRL